MVLLNIFPAEELIPSPSHKYLEYISREITKIQVKDTDTYIVPAGLEGNQGIIGAMNLF